jgi:hypothetical protein
MSVSREHEVLDVTSQIAEQMGFDYGVLAPGDVRRPRLTHELRDRHRGGRTRQRNAVTR